MVKASIEDVAERAGLSVATVDRVLNGRAKVRPGNAMRVEAAVRALNYHPDRLAARLARGREYRFCFIVPKGQNDFMASIEREISDHARHLQAERVSADIMHIDTFDSEAMVANLDAISGFDGVAIVALDDPRVKEAINRLVAKGVAVVTLVSDVPGSQRNHYIGIDNAAAGRTAATLMGRYLANHSGTIGIIAGSLSLRDHAERHFGFHQVMVRDFPKFTLLPVLEARDSNEQTNGLAKKLLDKTPDLLGLYNIGAGTAGFVAALSGQITKSRRVAVAHELNDISRKALMDGILDVVISQDPGHEVRSAMRLLMAKCDRLPVNPAMERIGIDIFVRDNLP